MERIEIKIGGIGGQGVLYAAGLLGQAACLEHKYVAVSASYGAESRGSLTTAEVVISDNESTTGLGIDYPHCEEPNFLIALHQKAYDAYKDNLSLEGTIFIDSSLVRQIDKTLHPHHAIPATQLAREKLGNVTLANLILVGLFSKVSGIISKASLLRVLKELTSPDRQTLAQKALQLGWEK